jgi:UDP-N-acetylglucosamine 2-epimerase
MKNKPDIEKLVVKTSQHTNKFYEKMGFKLLKVGKDYCTDVF